VAATGRDEQKAALAVGHYILVIAWHLLRNNTDYTDLGADWFARRIDNNTRRRDHLIHELQTMGYCVTGTDWFPAMGKPLCCQVRRSLSIGFVTTLSSSPVTH
jgi:hypothetical protein